MDEQKKNLILAIALSFVVVLIWSIMFAPPAQQPGEAPARTAQIDSTGAVPPTASTSGGTTPQATPAPAATIAETRDVALAKTKRVTIDTPSLVGSINLAGGRIDDLKLRRHRVSVDKESEIITLFSPAGGPQPYYALHGWAPSAGLSADQVPSFSTEWQVESGDTLGVDKPVTLVWDNGAGLIFRKTISVDPDYLFTISQSVENTSDADVSLFPYGIIARTSLPDLTGFFVIHEGLIAQIDDTLYEESYDSITDFDAVQGEAGDAVEKFKVETTGWIGFTDHFWMATLIPDAKQPFTAVVKYFNSNGGTYQTETRLPTMTIAAGATQTVQTRLFAGAKNYDIITRYQDQTGVPNFVNSIDWGWFSILTRPIFWALHKLNGMIGNMGWAILALTLIIKILLFPLAYKSYVSMAKMKELQPEMEKIKERAGDDRQKLQQEMMKLYREKKVNPAAGCLPILVQIPIFFSLYKVIFVTLDLRHAPFIGWIRDLSAPDPSSILNLFGLLPWDTPEPGSLLFILSIGVLPILMGITMWMQQKLNPAPTDKTQAMIFAWMPWIFMFMLGSFASGLVLYWTANNIITFIQQYTIMRSQGVKPDVFGNIMSSFKRNKSTE
ncbi:membrane protein insertase YidC [Halovulum sp. GXIMD14793]